MFGYPVNPADPTVSKTSAGSPVVSVVIPIHNRAHLLSRALRSVLHQTYRDFEIIVVDDGSSDDPQMVAQKFSQAGVRMRCLCLEQSQGASAARNRGIEAARGAYVAFLDSDDEWLPEKLERQIHLFEHVDEKVGVIYTGAWLSTKGERVRGRIPTRRGDIHESELRGDYVTQTSTWLVRTKCLDLVGGFDERLPSRQDYDLTLRLSRRFHYDFVRKPLAVLHVDHPDRITGNVEDRIQGTLIVLDKIQRELSECGWWKSRRIISHHLYALGRFCCKAGEYDLGASYLRRAIRQFPFYPKYWVVLVSALGGKQSYHRLSSCVSKLKQEFGVRSSP